MRTTSRNFLSAAFVLLSIINFICGAHVVTSKAAPAEVNDYPIIGIFTQPSSSLQGNCNGDCLYLAASYVKYLESSGARVVPINYHATDAEMDDLLRQLNGVFFPGGGAAFPAAAQYAFDKIKEMNDAGDYMPLWGTCMGFQWLLIAQSKDVNILDPSSGQLDSYNISLPLDFTPAAASSKLFADAPLELMQILAKQNVTMNNHHYGIYPEHFAETPSLASFYSVLSTNEDREGVAFVSTMEAFDYPIVGAQWHPEKNNFEWAMNSDGSPYEAINHSSDAVLASQYVADYFVQMARRNSHSFDSAQAEGAALIWNYPVTKTTGDFVQTYYFHF